MDSASQDNEDQDIFEEIKEVDEEDHPSPLLSKNESHKISQKLSKRKESNFADDNEDEMEDVPDDDDDCAQMNGYNLTTKDGKKL